MWILVVEDEVALGQLLRSGLQEEGHTVALAEDGEAAMEAATQHQFDAIVLDLMLPAIDGLEVLKRLRTRQNHVPILILTARDAAADIVRGLDSGADDYLTKPFRFDELLARLRAISRRGVPARSICIEVEDLVLDPVSHTVTRGGKPIELTATEFRLLECLMRRNGRIATRNAILEAVWGNDRYVESNTLDVFIRLLRSKIDGDRPNKLIQTVRGFGYRLAPGSGS
ncbi:MAG: response regulator transcription factor [Acidobacteriota bacterium]